MLGMLTLMEWMMLKKKKNPAEIYFNFDDVKKPSEKWFSGLEEARRELDKR